MAPCDDLPLEGVNFETYSCAHYWEVVCDEDMSLFEPYCSGYATIRASCCRCGGGCYANATQACATSTGRTIWSILVS